MLNYARMTPVYLAPMYELKEKDENIWVLLDAGRGGGRFLWIYLVFHSQLLEAITTLNRKTTHWKLLVESRV